MSKLSKEQIDVYLRKLTDWQLKEDKIVKSFTFKSFMEAITFVNDAAAIAEKNNHHPDMLIEFSKVTVSLTSHDAGGITGKDFLLAEELEKQQNTK